LRARAGVGCRLDTGFHVHNLTKPSYGARDSSAVEYACRHSHGAAGGRPQGLAYESIAVMRPRSDESRGLEQSLRQERCDAAISCHCLRKSQDQCRVFERTPRPVDYICRDTRMRSLTDAVMSAVLLEVGYRPGHTGQSRRGRTQGTAHEASAVMSLRSYERCNIEQSIREARSDAALSCHCLRDRQDQCRIVGRTPRPVD
jgi:hypothetical protein